VLTLETSHPVAGQLLTWDLHVHFKVQGSNDWQWAQWGDQSTSPPDGWRSENPDVVGDASGQCEAAGTDLTFVYHRAYRLGGDWSFLVPYQYAPNCDSRNTTNPVVTIRGTVHVGEGPWLQNGPMAPEVYWSGNLHTTNCPSGPTVCVQEQSDDFDGWVDRMSLDWGDGSAPYVLTEAPPATCEPANQCPPRPNTWPRGGLFTGPPISHTYPHNGAYTITLYAHSEGCDGSQGASVTWTASVNAGGY
jgi:hypothetical protein